MKKLNTLFVALAMVGTLGAGCKKKDEAQGKDEPAKTDTAAKPADPAAKPADPAAAPAAAAPAAAAPAAAAPAAPAAGGGDLPAECNDYKAAIDKLASCDKLPQQSRDALKQAYDQASAAWASVPDKTSLATGCKAGADAIKQSAAAVCGW